MPNNSRVSRSRNSAPQINANINIVPYVDVMLVLIVILLASASSVLPSIINLPKVGQKSVKISAKPTMIIIDNQGSLSLNQAKFADIDRLIQELKLKYSLEQSIIIAGDKDSRYEYIVSAMSNLKKAGFTKVGLLVKTQK
ncbi:MAG: protein TolR [Pseudomonadota bacterium]|jgi:biopolymer transport protein TolR